MKKILSLAMAALFTWCAAMAVPAKPGFSTFTQSDGTKVTVQLMGDEFFHYFVTQDGLPVDRDDNGDFHYMTPQGLSAVIAHNAEHRTTAELSFIQGQQTAMRQAMKGTPHHQARRASARRKVGQTQVPTHGSPRVPILLVQYVDKKMSNTVEQFEAHYKTSAKSVLQYFTDQSNGKYTPQYDIYGIYDLPNNRSAYGANNSNGDDQGVALMVCDAIDKAGDEIDWSLYDNDGDGEADVCIVVYAGPGEAQGGPRTTVWPCQWDLESGAYYNDGDGPRTRNGVVINRFAVFNETSGSSDYSSTMDGIGTFCHEFSHCLGLPDFYCTTYASGRYGMGGWSLMNSGCYNGGSVSGDTPIGYSAYEKNFMDWIEYIEATPNTYYTLPVFNAKDLTTDQAVKIVSDLNENEYFILENRRKQGWDQYIADEGVLITHFTYVPNRWEANTVNNESIQLATIIQADNQVSEYSEDKDLYGETNHEFSPTSVPAMKLNMRANGTLASTTGGAGVLDKPVTDIVLNGDGTASFWYIQGELKVTPEHLAIRASEGKQKTATFKVSGTGLPQDAVITLNDSTGTFAIDKTSLTPDQVKNGTDVTVTFSPRAIENYQACVTVACEGIDTLTVMLDGEGLILSETPVMQPANQAEVSVHSFRADWTDGSPAENVKSYTLYVDKKPDLPPFMQLIDQSFSTWQDVAEQNWWYSEYTNIANNLADYGLEGWSGQNIFSYKGALQIGQMSQGWYGGSNLSGQLNTTTFDLTDYDGVVSVVVNGKSTSSSLTNLSFAVGKGNSLTSSKSVAMSSSFADYTTVLNGQPGEGSFIRMSTETGRPVQLQSIKVYAGDITQAENAPLLAVIEQGDSTSRVIEGITDTHYVVNDLIAGATYFYKVEAVYVNDTRSDLSNIEQVTLLEAEPLKGDVDGNGKVDIADVNILINIMLGKDTADKYAGRAYVTDDQAIDIADVNAVINLMLGK
ncbi:MAG: M6 family metalloprotease domain-containing protein [Muribaculaceae bacterium]|nr:M6 family metalloprotease domain-containing protein [Muribaculaceae bacterium]